MKQELIQLLTAGIGTLGFSIYFRVREKNVIASTIGGVLGFAVYLIIYKLTQSLFFANFLAALAVYTYSEICARILKAPSNIFMIPGIIPLLPGGTLYYTMYALVIGDKQMLTQNASSTAVITVGIATGIVVGTVIVYYFINPKSKSKKV